MRLPGKDNARLPVKDNARRSGSALTKRAYRWEITRAGCLARLQSAPTGGRVNAPTSER